MMKQKIELVHNNISKFVHRTPVLSSSQINEIMGCEIEFKCENFQKAGSFKSRGAVNAILNLSSAHKQKGVCTHSSGNFAQALARAASIIDIKSYIVMPENAPNIKIEATKNYGGKISLCKPTLQAREDSTDRIIKEKGAKFIHPYDNIDVVLGQATAAKEFIQDSNTEFDYIIAPVGGGGLLSGTALSCKYFSHKTKVIGAEPYNSMDAYKSFKCGKIIASDNPKTIADGLLTSLGEINFPIINEYVNDIFLCSEENIILAMQYVFNRMKIIIEPSAAVALAVVIENKSFFANKKVGIILSGGNVDFNEFFTIFGARIKKEN